jgi:hypothetical protein
MVSMIPPESLDRLRKHFGEEFEGLNQTQVSALVTADLEGEVSNRRMRQISKEHRSDLTTLLQDLVARGFLEQNGRGRWTTYHLPANPPRDLIGRPQDLIDLSRDLIDSDSDLVQSLEDFIDTAKGNLDLEESGVEGKAIWRGISAQKVADLKALAEPGKSRIPAEGLTGLILKLCLGCYLTKTQLAELLDRNADHLYHRYLKPLVSSGKLRLKYPESRSRPGQAYRTVAQEDQT